MKLYTHSKNTFFGKQKFGGQYVPEILYPALKELEEAYHSIFASKEFKKEFDELCKHFIGRPTPLVYARNASRILHNDVYLKLEGQAITGAHKINNALGQAMLAKKMGKTRVIAETGAGQHGLATACACAKLGLECEIFMGSIDMARQRPNVLNMELFGAKVRSVDSGSKTLKDAVNEALREWSKDMHQTFYVLGSALGPYPYPDIVRDLQSIISKEVKKQVKYYFKGLPDFMVACVGGGSNAIGFFHAFLKEKVQLIGVEAGGRGMQRGEHAARMQGTEDAHVGIAQGYKSIFLQDDEGQLSPTHSISAGLDYAGIGPQLAHLGSIGRVKFDSATDNEVLEALKFFAKHEGIIAALESSHALAGAMKLCKNHQGKKIIINISGRGDKDIFITAKHLQPAIWAEFLQEEIARIKDAHKEV
ncbi:tryptophan synthase subunit beta [Helicobacter mustelae]|uniref:Tryptophan synthase beta chain n=1 Tax=Helicobacter mustelae (strain ATCC 43772 / CCUG 25715 / CIP 103759 / LMG 18044 / NCTC 12198 / R85-136P) TaxID=679897 RepID=D3UH65_HELM1|nr:tryptophan synthase beta chain [Helicobacter mustelae 12198]SQH71346.1 tryptophan synthase subunit beta [Helicobacter mustelae]